MSETKLEKDSGGVNDAVRPLGASLARQETTWNNMYRIYHENSTWTAETCCEATEEMQAVVDVAICLRARQLMHGVSMWASNRVTMNLMLLKRNNL